MDTPGTMRTGVFFFLPVADLTLTLLIIESRGVKLMFTVGHISIMVALLKGQIHFINASKILLNNFLCI